jgi:23S rRNA (guanosine2251-2'-O)-methyltransferase
MIIYGKQVCLHILEKHKDRVKVVYVAKKNILPQNLFHDYHDKIKFLEEKWAQSMSKGGNHQGILIETDEFVETTISQVKNSNKVLFLDGVTDVGNIGAIVRSSYALGVDAIVTTNVKQLNYAAIARSSSGALFDMPMLVVPNGLDLLNELKQLNFKLYGADIKGTPLSEVDFAGKQVLVMGSEDKGISKRILQKMDEVISIEMKNDFNSLNVSVATAILLYRMR